MVIIFYLAATIKVIMDEAIFVATKRVAIDVAMFFAATKRWAKLKGWLWMGQFFWTQLKGWL